MKANTPPKKDREITTVLKQTHKSVSIKNPSLDEYDSYDEWIGMRSKFIKSLLRKGFRYLNSGGFKSVYRHPKYSEYVVKVYRNACSHTEDTNMKLLPKWLRKYFLEPIEINELYIIQPFANGKRGTYKTNRSDVALYRLIDNQDRVDKASALDIRAGNTKFHDGEPVIIDFCN